MASPTLEVFSFNLASPYIVLEAGLVYASFAWKHVWHHDFIKCCIKCKKALGIFVLLKIIL